MKTGAQYESWLSDVEQALASVGMPLDDWQKNWAFDFRKEFKSGASAVDAAAKANRFWWRQQNRAIDQDCRLMPECWLPRNHQGECEPVS